MPAGSRFTHHWAMTLYLVQHRHEPAECGAAFAAWKGFDSPLRQMAAWCSCLTGGHRLWLVADAPDETTVLGLLPRYLAERSDVSRVAEVTIP
jgi:hypothetical protein